jgi:hypothetical protein
MAWVMPQMGHDSLKEFWKNKQGQVISSDVTHDDADQLHSIIELSRAQTIDASTAHIETVLSSALSEPKCGKAKALAGHRHRGDGGRNELAKKKRRDASVGPASQGHGDQQAGAGEDASRNAQYAVRGCSDGPCLYRIGRWS